MFRVFALVAALFVPVAAATAADSLLCGSRGDIVRFLEEAYAETPTAAGRMADGKTFEILVSKQGSWTMIVTEPNGRSCAEASGRDFRSAPIRAAGGAAT